MLTLDRSTNQSPWQKDPKAQQKLQLNYRRAKQTERSPELDELAAKFNYCDRLSGKRWYFQTAIGFGIGGKEYNCIALVYCLLEIPYHVSVAMNGLFWYEPAIRLFILFCDRLYLTYPLKKPKQWWENVSLKKQKVCSAASKPMSKRSPPTKLI